VANVYIKNDDPAVAEAAKRVVGERRAAEDQAFADKLAKRPSPNPVERAEIEKARKHGPVYFRRESEPYMTLAIAGTRRDAGVSVAEVNLKLIWDVVSQIKVVLL
jgi:hypothetical protein